MSISVAAAHYPRRRQQAGLAELALRSGVSKAYISDLENGIAGKPNVQYLYSIAVGLDAALDQLVNDAVEMETAGGTTSKQGVQLPPGLEELRRELSLSDDDVEELASVNFRHSKLQAPSPFPPDEQNIRTRGGRVISSARCPYRFEHPKILASKSRTLLAQICAILDS
ncbi:MAG TPA: helix-turn-helix transcriptional regulator [Bryobacteraceae bacterium]|nr:helix-turn-helix transcriptional regulator [Bryobacteraceae bacterium]